MLDKIYNLRRKFVYVIVSFLSLFIKRNVILFESLPEFGGSPWVIYLELIRRDYDKKYKLVWAIDSRSVIRQNVSCVPFFGPMSFIQRIKSIKYAASSKLIVENSRFIVKRNYKTYRFHAQHGAPLKKCFSYTHSIGDLDAILSLSDNTVQLEQNIFPTARGKIYALGYPSNDSLFDVIDLYGNGFWPKITNCEKKYDKIIGWLPTYRQHRHGSNLDSGCIFPYGVPLLKSLDEFEKINAYLAEKNTLLAIQIHHAQLNNFPNYEYSNIVVVSPSIKQAFNVSTANLMQSFDALITDYSGAYHEYLLLDRPIALSIDDYEEYAKNPGFSLDYFEWIKGVYLKTVCDLMNFIGDVTNGIDSAKKERETAMHRIHKYIDNQSTKRVVDFLIEKAIL